ncbi:MAG: hypothetical protein Kow0025_20440 [Thermodesulfovibrionales bacterium]
MDSARLGLILGLFLFTFLINLPFGYMRGRSRKGSLRWFLCIHLPIPLVFLGRTLSHLDIRFVPIFVVAAVAGQLWGGRLES